MKKEYNFLEIRLVYLYETDVITASSDYADAPNEDSDILGDDIF